MITWKFWTTLRTPYVAHPIYRLRVIRNPQIAVATPNQFWRRLETHSKLWMMIAGVIATTIAGLFGFPMLLMLICIPVFVVFFLLLPLLLVIIGTLYGLMAALAVANMIITEKVEGRYTLMMLTPHGLVGATWALCSLTFHTNSGLTQIRQLILNVYLSSALTIILAFYPFLALVQDGAPRIMTWSAAFCILIGDFIQSTNTGCLVGMLVPTVSRSRASARSYGLVLFLTLQLGTYIAVSLLCFTVWPGLHIVISRRPDTIAVICALTYLLCREVITIALLVVFIRRMDTTLAEWDEITGMNVRRPPHIPFVSSYLARLVKPVRAALRLVR